MDAWLAFAFSPAGMAITVMVCLLGGGIASIIDRLNR
jgi:hypothetical protein